MKKFLMTAAACVLLTTTAAHATSEGVKLHSGENWQTTYFAQNGAGVPMCVMSAFWTWPNKTFGMVMFKWSGDLGLFMHVTKSNWNIPKGEQVPMSISFDKGVRDGNGFVQSNDKKGTTIQINIGEDDATGFMEDFSNADTMTVAFTEGTERPWIAKMDGSRKANEWFDACIRKVRANSAAVTTSPVAPKTTSPVAPKVTSPVNPTSPMPPVQPTDNRRKKDIGDI